MMIMLVDYHYLLNTENLLLTVGLVFLILLLLTSLDYSDEWENGFYRMTSDDDGEVTLGDLVKFRKAGYYRIYVEDYDGNENYIQFSVGGDDDEDDDESSVSGFSRNELSKVKSIYKEWDSLL